MLNEPPFRLLAALVLAGVGLTAAPAAAPAQELRYTRPVDVPEAGWVRAFLGSEVLRRAGAGGGFRLFGPEGDEIAFARLPIGARPPRPAEPRPPELAEGGWWLPLEVAPGGRLHERLVLSFDPPPGIEAAPAVRLEGSDDGETWQLLVVGGTIVDGGRLSLLYPATDLPLLRLLWPGPGTGEAPPMVVEAAVDEVPPGAFRLSIARPDCRAPEVASLALRAVCRLPLGGTGRYLRRLCFTVRSEAAAGYRVFRPDDGRWEPVAEATWGSAPGESPHCSPLDLTLTGDMEPLRLELYGSGEEAPTVRDVAAGFAPEAVVFEARRPGVYTLAYGPAVFPGARERDVEPPPGVQPTGVALGPEESTEISASSLSLPTAAGPAPAVRFQETWELTAEAPSPGQLHRLTLPPRVYAGSRAELADLRLLVSVPGSRTQVPYVLWRPDEPALAAERRGVSLSRGDAERGVHRVRIEPPDIDLPLSALVVSAVPAVDPGAAGSASERRVRVLAEDDVGEDRETGPWVEWACPATSPLPCRVTVPLDGARSDSLVVEIDDGGAPPFSQVDFELWRRRDVVLFPWPGDDAIPLLAVGADGLAAPEFDLSDRAQELVARPWREATLAAEGSGRGGLGSITITLALLAAAATLVALLHRILADQAPSRRRNRS